MLQWLLAFMAMGLLGCSGSPAMRVERRAVGPVASAPKPLRRPAQLPRATSEHAGTLEDPVEPFSASWLEPEQEREEVEAWVNSDVCPDPLGVEDDPDLAPEDGDRRGVKILGHAASAKPDAMTRGAFRKPRAPFAFL